MIKTNKRKHEKGNERNLSEMCLGCWVTSIAFPCEDTETSSHQIPAEKNTRSRENGENTEEGSEDPYEKYFRF